MTNDTDEKFQELADAAQTEAMLRERIEAQARRIAVALGYIRCGRPDLAAKVLEETKL